MGCSVAAIVGSEELAGPEAGRGRSIGDTLDLAHRLQWHSVSISASGKHKITLLR